MEALNGGAAQLRARTGRDLSLAAIMSVLGKYPCPNRCFIALSKNEYSRVDQFYSERHRYLQRLLVDRLRIQLLKTGVRARLAAEQDLRTGKGDVDVMATGSGVEVRGFGVVVRLELKGGSNFDISQVIRYLVDADAVVVALCARGRALVVRSTDATRHIESVISTLNDKLQSLLIDSSERITGPWCAGCPVLDCPDRKQERVHQVDFETEFQLPLSNWIAAIDDAIGKTLGLLEQLTKPAANGGVKP